MKNQAQYDLALQQNLMMGMEQEAANQEDAILQEMATNMMNSVNDIESKLYDGVNDLNL